MTQPRVLVTGGAGFIGSHLVDDLLRSGSPVRVLDSFFSGSRKNLATVAADVEVVEGDLGDSGALQKAVTGCDVIYHLAALNSVRRSFEIPEETHRVNAQGTLDLLEAAAGHGVRRVVLASSSSVYGASPASRRKEGVVPAPLSPYAGSKLEAEEHCHRVSIRTGLETVVLRYFNVFGPRQSAALPYGAVMARFVAAAVQGRPLTIYGDGEQSRDFTYVSDVVAANRMAATVAGAAGGCFNIATGTATSVNELSRLVGDALNRGIDVERAARRPADVDHSVADISAAWLGLGYAPVVPLAAGIQRTVEHHAQVQLPAA